MTYRGRCPECGRNFGDTTAAAFRCCDRPVEMMPAAVATSDPRRQLIARHCGPNCEHWGRRDGRSGCLLLDRPCDVVTIQIRDACPAGKFPAVRSGFRRGGVGFVAVSYLECGGTEVWHQTLLPRLGDRVSGFVCVNPDHARGDFARLGCPWGVGVEDARRLARACDVLVVWGIGRQLGNIVDGLRFPPRVISVSHCDPRSEWTCDMMRGQNPWTDRAVFICPSGRDTVPAGQARRDAVLIHNAPDPERVRATTPRDETRRRLGIGESDRVVLVTSRISPEKRIDILARAMQHLPPDVVLLISGTASTWSQRYADDVRAINPERVRVIDAVATPGDLLAAADVAASASTFEGYGLAMAEAILAGVPLIATPCGLLESMPTVARVVPHDATAIEWADAIAADLADPAGARHRAALARHAVATRHSVERFTAAWSELISETTV